VIEGFPAIDLAHLDLAGCEQGSEQHRHGLRRGQHGLRLDSAAEFLVQPLDRIRNRYAILGARFRPTSPLSGVGLSGPGERHREHQSAGRPSRTINRELELARIIHKRMEEVV
jgi:hypothetical protein